MKKIITLAIVLLLVLLSVRAFAHDPKIEVVNFDWGGLSARENGIVIDVREELTTEKKGLSGFFTQDYGKAIKPATEEAKKLLSLLYNIIGVANVRFSTYQILIIMAPRFTPEEIQPKVVTAMDNWHLTVTKQEPEPKE